MKNVNNKFFYINISSMIQYETMCYKSFYTHSTLK